MCTVKCYANPGTGRVNHSHHQHMYFIQRQFKSTSTEHRVLSSLKWTESSADFTSDKLQHRIIAVVYMSSHIVEDSKYTQIVGMVSR